MEFYTEHLHIMIDLETLGKTTDAVVTELSAVAFKVTGEIVSDFSVFISKEDQVTNYGRTICPETIAWWESQTAEARKIQEDGAKEAVPLLIAMMKFEEWVQRTNANFHSNVQELPSPIAWGNGISFDLGKIHSMMETNDMSVPWDYWAEADVRTIHKLVPHHKQNMEFIGTPHFGLDDCKHQIRYLTAGNQELTALLN